MLFNQRVVYIIFQSIGKEIENKNHIPSQTKKDSFYPLFLYPYLKKKTFCKNNKSFQRINQNTTKILN